MSRPGKSLKNSANVFLTMNFCKKKEQKPKVATNYNTGVFSSAKSTNFPKPANSLEIN